MPGQKPFLAKPWSKLYQFGQNQIMEEEYIFLAQFSSKTTFMLTTSLFTIGYFVQKTKDQIWFNLDQIEHKQFHGKEYILLTQFSSKYSYSL